MEFLQKNNVPFLDDGAVCSQHSPQPLGGVADTLEGFAAIQGILNRLDKCADQNLMKFNTWKCKVVHQKEQS